MSNEIPLGDKLLIQLEEAEGKKYFDDFREYGPIVQIQNFNQLGRLGRYHILAELQAWINRELAQLHAAPTVDVRHLPTETEE